MAFPGNETRKIIHISGLRESDYSSKTLKAEVNTNGSVKLIINETAGPSSLGGAGITLSKEDVQRLIEVLKP